MPTEIKPSEKHRGSLPWRKWAERRSSHKRRGCVSLNWVIRGWVRGADWLARFDDSGAAIKLDLVANVLETRGLDQHEVREKARREKQVSYEEKRTAIKLSAISTAMDSVKEWRGPFKVI
jgi:hypothetical protein